MTQLSHACARDLDLEIASVEFDESGAKLADAPVKIRVIRVF